MSLRVNSSCLNFSPLFSLVSPQNGGDNNNDHKYGHGHSDDQGIVSLVCLDWLFPGICLPLILFKVYCLKSCFNTALDLIVLKVTGRAAVSIHELCNWLICNIMKYVNLEYDVQRLSSLIFRILLMDMFLDFLF